MRIANLAVFAALLVSAPQSVVALNTQWAYGNAVRYYTEEDWAAEEKAVSAALDGSADGVTSEWQGGESGITGTVQPLKSYRNQEVQSCRLVELTSKRMEQVERAAGHFCMDAAGEWVFVGMAKLKQ
jgi:surface antigen